MKTSKTDVAVLILFFNRPAMLEKVFEQVRLARPSRLYLYQDGARQGREDDIINVQKCRDIVSNIDWECEVHHNYQETNNGCDPSEYLAQKWMFETEEMGIVLEDDDVPSQSFFPFCKELLEKYKDDQRINMICGMNNLQIYKNCPYDYFFSRTGSITGWASWKRVIDEWQPYVPFVEDDYAKWLFNNSYKKVINTNKYIKHTQKCNESGIAYYENILGSNAFMQNRLNIVTTKNMISNIGNVGESTHGATDIKLLPRGIRRIFNMPTYDVDFPINHPPYVVEDKQFHKQLNRVMANGHPFISFYRKCESVIYRMVSGDFSMFKRKFKRVFSRKK